MIEVLAGIAYLIGELRARPQLLARLGGNADRVVSEFGSIVFPFVSVGVYTGIDLPVVGAAGGGRLSTSMQYIVRAVAKGGQNYGAVALIAAEISEALDNADGKMVTVEGYSYWIPGATRESPYTLREDRDGITYWYMGGIYRVPVDPTT